MKKRKIVFLVLVVCLLISGCKKGKKGSESEQAPQVLSEYKIENDLIKSVPWVIGEDRFCSYEKYFNVALPSEDGEETEEETEEETTEEETAEEETKEEGEEEVPLDPDDDGSKKVIYAYEGLETGTEDAVDYILYLVEQEDFIEQWAFDESAPAGYVSLIRDSVDEGWMFQVDVDYTPRSYRVILSKWEAPVIEKTEGKKQEIKISSMEQAIDYVRSYSPRALNISDEDSLEGYSLTADSGRRPIGGVEYYVVNVYKNHEDMTKTIAGTYYVGVNTGQILRYDLDTNSYTEVAYNRNAFEGSGSGDPADSQSETGANTDGALTSGEEQPADEAEAAETESENVTAGSSEETLNEPEGDNVSQQESQDNTQAEETQS